MLVDGYGREVTDIRVSVTDRCNFRCVYCHNEGQGEVRAPSAPRNGELAPDEIARILRVARGFDIRSVKISGGEPLLRADLEDILRAAPEDMEKSLVTNGSMLASRARGLRAAGLARLNISVDTLDPVLFRELGRGHLGTVLEGVAAALDAGIRPVKLNMVVFKPTLPVIPQMLDHVAGREGLRLQLIEYMPELVGGNDLRVDIREVKRYLESRADSVEVRGMHHRRVYHVDGAEVEVVDPVGNAEFCFNCHRLRVTADGHLKGCLNRNDDLVPLRGLDDDGLRDAFRRVVAQRVPYYGVHVHKRPETGRAGAGLPMVPRGVAPAPRVPAA